MSTFIAAALLLPVLGVILFGGLAVAHLVEIKQEISSIQQDGLIQEEIAGGLTAQVRSFIEQDIRLYPDLAAFSPSIAGTSRPVPWGKPLWLSIYCPIPLQGFPWGLIGLSSHTLNVGGMAMGTSNLVP